MADTKWLMQKGEDAYFVEKRLSDALSLADRISFLMKSLNSKGFTDERMCRYIEKSGEGNHTQWYLVARAFP